MNRLHPRLCLTLALALTACGSSQSVARSSPTALQQFDAMRTTLRRTTVQSSIVAEEARILGKSMQHDDAPGTRSGAVRLKRDALAFSRLSGRNGNLLRVISGKTYRQVVRRYFSLLVSALSCQWWEGRTLARLADLAWSDPHVAGHLQEREWRGTTLEAAREARCAVLSSYQAWRLENQARAAFRYTPVQTHHKLKKHAGE